jgi:hypothetical protein
VILISSTTTQRKEREREKKERGSRRRNRKRKRRRRRRKRGEKRRGEDRKRERDYFHIKCLLRVLLRGMRSAYSGHGRNIKDGYPTEFFNSITEILSIQVVQFNGFIVFTELYIHHQFKNILYPSD